MGDHKPAGPFRSGKYSSYDGGTHVAFLLRWPGQVKPGKSDALICQMDLYASFAAMLGRENKTRDGENVIDALLGKSKKGRSELLLDACGDNVLLRQGDWICIPPMVHEGYWVAPMESGRMKITQLFNVKKDIGQKNNVAEKYPKRAAAMEKRAKEIRDSK